MKIKPSSLTFKVLLTIIGISLLFSIATSAIQLINHHQSHKQKVITILDNIKKNYVPFLSKALSNSNKERIQADLDKIIILPHMRYAQVQSLPNTHQISLSSNTQKKTWDIEKSFKLFSPNSSPHLNKPIGVLTIKLGYVHLHSHFYIIFLTSIIKMLIISLIIFFMINNMLTKHLSQIVKYANNLNLNDDGTPLRLCRKKHNTRDEIDELCDALNSLRIRIRNSIHGLNASKEKILQMQKLEALGTMMRGITHDFNNILMSTMGHIEEGQSSLSQTSPAFKQLEFALNASDQAKDLIKQILSFCKQDGQNIELFNLSEVVNETLTMIRSSAPSPVRVISQVSNNLIIKADRTQIIQVILNLTTNSIHSMNNGQGTLGIDLIKTTKNESGDFVCLIIKDTGKGMSVDIQKKIFDPFFTTKGPNEGSGLGLSVVHGIITRMNGKIEVYSIPGYGTKFSIYIPLSNQKLKKAVNISSPTITSPPPGTTILLVDDEENLVKLYTKMLSRLGYKIIPTTHPREAIEIYKNNIETIKLIITDYTMPTMNGLDLALEIRKMNSNIPIILSTGQLHNDYEKSIKENIINGVLHKPFRKKEISLFLQQFLTKQKT